MTSANLAFASAVCVGAVLRVWVSTLGHNDDFVTWSRVAGFVAAGQNVYASTQSYNYGPIWAELLGVIKWADAAFRVNNLHASIAMCLTLVDVAIAVVLVRLAGDIAGIVFMLCPVSILLTGYHSQFDNLAVLLALLAWRTLARVPTGLDSPWRRLVPAALLMGASLATKHLMLFFPLWLLFWPRRPLVQRLTFGVLAYVLFAAAFAPFATTPAAIAGINTNVFHYRSDFGAGLFERLVSLILPEWVPAWFGWVPIFPGLQCLWVMAMGLTGVVVARKFREELFFIYPIALLAYTPSMAEQYLAIPLVSCALYWRRWQSWAYIAVASALLSSSPVNIGGLPAVKPHTAWLRDTGFITFHNAQMCMLVLLLSFYYTSGQPRSTDSVLD